MQTYPKAHSMHELSTRSRTDPISTDHSSSEIIEFYINVTNTNPCEFPKVFLYHRNKFCRSGFRNNCARRNIKQQQDTAKQFNMNILASSSPVKATHLTTNVEIHVPPTTSYSYDNNAETLVEETAV